MITDIIRILQQSTIVQFSVTIFSVLVAIFLITIRKRIEGVFNYGIDVFILFLKKAFKRKYILHGAEINRDVVIKELLIELRTILKSDRASVLQFHNGSQFNTSNPMWKVSKTHESVTVGVSSELSKVQNILSSSISDLLCCFWRNDKLSRGIYKISPGDCMCENKNTCNLPRGVFLICVEELEEGFSKAHLQEQGIRYTMITPLVDGESRIGFIGVDYTRDVGTEEITKYATDICKYATNISYILVYENFSK